MFLKIEGSLGNLRGFLEKVKPFQGSDWFPGGNAQAFSSGA